MLQGIDAVLFDLDGTLIDSAPDLGAAADKMRTDRGLASLSQNLYRPMAGAGARGMIAVAFGIAPQDKEFNELKEEFFTNYERRLTQSTYVFEGITELISCICLRGIKWGVVTNKSTRFTIPLTQAIPLFETAQTIISGDTMPYSKPHPAPLIEAARQLQVRPEHCVYVGDDERDIIAGRTAGMATVAAAYGYLGTITDIHTWKADFAIARPSDLLKLLKIV